MRDSQPQLRPTNEVCALVVKKYFNGHKPTDKEIAAVYDHWGKWKYLAYRFDSA
jgi:hypothetical protein